MTRIRLLILSFVAIGLLGVSTTTKAVGFGCLDNYNEPIGLRCSGYGSTVKVLENGASDFVEYKSYNSLLHDLKQKAQLNMWSRVKMKQEMNYLPKNGYIIISIAGSTIDSANTKYWTYIITKNGKEIMRQNGSDSIPSFSTSEYGLAWYNTDIFPVPNRVNDKFKVYIINNSSETASRSAFIVYPNIVNPSTNREIIQEKKQEEINAMTDSAKAEATKYFKEGEKYFAAKQYDKAIIAYDSIVTRFPGSKYLANAMLKEGISFLKLNDSIDAKYLFSKAVQEFPKSKQAKTANKYLDDIE